MKRKLISLTLVALLLMASGCGGGSKGGNMEASRPGSTTAASDMQDMQWDSAGTMEMGGAAEPSASPEGGGEENSIYRNTDAKLIRRAELSIQTEEFDKAVDALNKLVSDCGGYFETSQLYAGSIRNTNASRTGEYVARVPAEKYGVFLSGSGSLGYLSNIIESSDDIGEPYYDTEARLKTQRAKQERLLSLLTQAATMEDIISLENALSETEYQIEQLSSTLNRYDSLVGFSTFTIHLNEVHKITEEVGEQASLGQRMGAGFASSLDSFVRGCQELLVWLSYNLLGLVVLAAVAGGAGFAGWKLVKRHRAKRAAKEKPEQ